MDAKRTWYDGEPAKDPVERALAEIDSAILLVVAGGATVVTLCGFDGVDAAACAGAAAAQDAGVGFRLRRGASSSVVIGPRLPVALAGPGS